VLVLADEEEKTFIELLDGLMREHSPQTDAQRLLVESMAAARWRLLRTWSMGRSTLDPDKQDPVAHPPVATALSPSARWPSSPACSISSTVMMSVSSVNSRVPSISS
jgi:hypothetical protein